MLADAITQRAVSQTLAIFLGESLSPKRLPSNGRKAAGVRTAPHNARSELPSTHMITLPGFPISAVLFLVVALAGPASAQQPTPGPAATGTPLANPLLTESTLPYHLPPFDQIKDADFEPAYTQGMAEHLKEVAAIAGNAQPPTFENTVVALERSGRLLERVERTFSNLAAANTNPAIQTIESTMAPRLAAHADDIHLNAALFARLQSIYDQRDHLNLDPESKYLLERYEKDFVRAGAKLSDPDKAKLKAMNAGTGLAGDHLQPETCSRRRTLTQSSSMTAPNSPG